MKHVHQEILKAADRERPVRLLAGGRLIPANEMIFRCGPCEAELTRNCSVCLEEDGADEKVKKGLMFRCKTCLRPAHYEHRECVTFCVLPITRFMGNRMSVATIEGQPRPRKMNVSTLAGQYQEDAKTRGDAWKCCDCRKYTTKVDMVSIILVARRGQEGSDYRLKILAWRPLENANAKIAEIDSDEPLHKIQAPREYLVKFHEWGFRHVRFALSSPMTDRLTNLRSDRLNG